jgi:hypothetical protein
VGFEKIKNLDVLAIKTQKMSDEFDLAEIQDGWDDST